MASYCREQVLDLLGVSRETSDKLDLYVHLLLKWQTTINLVAPNSLGDLWHRHILDSAQLHRFLPPAPHVVDLGSGAGFPGLILGFLGVDELHLIESDKRKAAFLQEAARITETPIILHAERIEAIHPFPVDCVTARALAPLPRLLHYAAPFLQAGGQGLFLKGHKLLPELQKTQELWHIHADILPSLTHADARILRVERISYVG